MAKRLLVVDNEAFSCPGHVNALKRKGYEVGYVTTEADYRTDMRDIAYDAVVLTDLRIPGLLASVEEPWKSGLGIVRDSAMNRGLPVLVCSAETADIDKEAESFGARVLKKPVFDEELIKGLENLEMK